MQNVDAGGRGVGKGSSQDAMGKSLRLVTVMGRLSRSRTSYGRKTLGWRESRGARGGRQPKVVNILSARGWAMRAGWGPRGRGGECCCNKGSSRCAPTAGSSPRRPSSHSTARRTLSLLQPSSAFPRILPRCPKQPKSPLCFNDHVNLDIPTLPVHVKHDDTHAAAFQRASTELVPRLGVPEGASSTHVIRHQGQVHVSYSQDQRWLCQRALHRRAVD